MVHSFMGRSLVPKGNLRLGIPKAKHALRDSDRDGFPRVIDCDDRNRNKQGIKDYIDVSVKTVGDEEKPKLSIREKIRKYREAVPERRKKRHEERMEKLQYRKEEAKERAELSGIRAEEVKGQIAVQQQKMGLAERRGKLMQQRQKAMGSMQVMPSIMGGMSRTRQGPPPSLMHPFGTPTSATPKPKPRKRKRKKKRK